MEIKINREIMQYSESVFLGLSLRQFVCSTAAVLAAVLVYLLCKNFALEEAASYLSMCAAAPFALLGFFKYNSMSAERFVCEFVKSEILERKIYVSAPRNIYMDLLSQ